MPQKKYLVTLTAEERQTLAKLGSAGKRSARTLTRARILLKADQADGGPAWEDAAIADALGCGHRTVERVRQRFGRRIIRSIIIVAACLLGAGCDVGASADGQGPGRWIRHAQMN